MLAPNFASALLSWYDTNRRDLPWRNNSEAYAVLVSEFMLQQTTVAAVIPRFEQWIKDFPTIEILASEEPETVLLKWEGLGYYSRARNLHLAAREIASKYGGKVPYNPVELKKLPGIGDYTAAAVASIAYGVRAPALDANNLRIWSRLLVSSDRKRITRIFSRVLPADRPGDFNQALMDLGTSTCTPKTPDCPQCPLAAWCRAYRGGRVSGFPPKKVRPETERIEAAIGVIVRDGKILVQKRPEGGLLAGLFEFPGGKVKETVDTHVSECVNAKERKEQSNPSTHRAHTHAREAPEAAVIREVREETGLSVQIVEKLGVFTHAYTKFRVKLHVFICKSKAGTVHNPTAKWVTLEELEGLAMPSVNRRIVKKLESYLTAEDAEERRGET